MKLVELVLVLFMCRYVNAKTIDDNDNNDDDPFSWSAKTKNSKPPPPIVPKTWRETTMKLDDIHRKSSGEKTLAVLPLRLVPIDYSLLQTTYATPLWSHAPKWSHPNILRAAALAELDFL